MEIGIVATEDQVRRLLPLMRAYCDFYLVRPSDIALLSMARTLIADPTREGVQLIASDRGADVGFATLFWSWETTTSGRIGVMNDLFVNATARGRGFGSALINACLERCRDHGAVRMTWQTAVDNVAAQAVYDHAGATRETWVDYWLETGVSPVPESQPEHA
ncbi:MAG TPA: GNAT family N-acetyltransferase [Candidatus Saccharimonadales bacterium]|nr:GNAT family N-acetyltransferase [Candidatus Saccharimonadales bacterium]